jgi:nucleoside-triphosphatase THEP1
MFLLTGASGAGKTAYCQQLLLLARNADLAPAGLISPAVFAAGVKTGIDLMDVASGERRRLAERRQRSSEVADSTLVTENWRFDPGVLAWGNRILEEIGYTQLFILDELGPLELLENRGLVAGLSIIDQVRFRHACVVIRPALLPTAQERWPWGLVQDLSASPLPETDPS